MFGTKRHCPHERIRGIYGDEINHVGGWRNQCTDCGRYLDGPVAIAKRREALKELVRLTEELGLYDD